MRGRIYLPVNELQRFDVKAHEILKRPSDAEFRARFARLMQFQAAARPWLVRRGLRAAARRRPPRAEARPDDGQHLPHLAARDRTRRLCRAAPARQPDAAAQVLAGLAGPGPGPGLSPCPASAPTRRLRAMKIAIVGAGWAGMAAAVTAVQAGHARHRVGGRHARWAAAPAPCRAQLPDGSAVVLDNGQHILIGAYSESLRLMRRVGVDPDTGLAAPAAAHPRFPMAAASRFPRWPAPLDALAGIATARGWQWPRQTGLAAAGTALAPGQLPVRRRPVGRRPVPRADAARA